jgi:TonB-linked SusC/RagA family outer membrane protein
MINAMNNLSCRIFSRFREMKAITILLIVFISGSVNMNAEENDSRLAKKPADKRGSVEAVSKLRQFNSEEEGLLQQKVVKGTVIDFEGIPLIGVTVVLKGTTIGTVTDIDGNFSLNYTEDNPVLVVSFVGMQSREIALPVTEPLVVILQESFVGLDEVVVVGYGTQKKQSLVGAISVASGDDLQRTGGVTNFAQALTGQLPGLVTIQTTGYPGANEPIIYIRGQSTWRGGQPYVLIDGIERSMADIDVNEVESVSILKDASATAVFGVKGANGVILITTKRGSDVGKPQLTISASRSMDYPSRLPNTFDSYNALKVRNMAIEREVVLEESIWGDIMAYPVVKRFQSTEGLKYPDAYPNVNWRDEMLKDFAISNRFNINLRGGSNQVRYFTSLSYSSDGDLLDVRPSNKGYHGGFGYDRLNFRSNLDFDITNTTRLFVNLGGHYGDQQDNYNHGEMRIWNAMYRLAPDLMQVVYSDGVWGTSPMDEVNLINPIATVSEMGIRRRRRTELNSTFNLDQNLDFITKGLSVRGTFAYDNTFNTIGGLTEGVESSVTQGYNTLMKWIDPAIEDAGPDEDPNDYIYVRPVTGVNHFEFAPTPWWLRPENVQGGNIRRRQYYQVSANYGRSFGKFDFSAMGVFSREQNATGSMFPRFREDWVFRTTYGYDSRYFLELNGAYNGSEQFGPGYRFDLFPSIAMGWMISEESFMDLKWLDAFKVRLSHGIIGDDYGGARWAYDSQWSYGGRTNLGQFTRENSPYVYYRESVIGNPDIHWEVSKKTDLGIEVTLLNGLISSHVDLFTERRTDILIPGGNQSVPDFFGGSPPIANLGEVFVKGFEVELVSRYRTPNGILFRVGASMGRAVDEIIFRDDPPLLPAYQMQQGFQIGQTRSQVSSGFYNNWDEVFASTQLQTNDAHKLPGHFNIIDFNGDGVIDSYDNVPVAYPMRPQNSYNLSLRTEYRGFRFHVQFYGVTNVSRNYPFPNFLNNTNIVFDQGDYWSKDNLNASSFVPRWKTSAQSSGHYYIRDASYLRLKTAELSYTFRGGQAARTNMPGVRVYMNGNNLLFWSKLPDDRESHAGGDAAAVGTYPTMKRINFGMELTF